jgi:hypothetical protein
VLVVDRHALLPVHALDLVHQVLLGLADALDVEDLLRVTRALRVTGELRAGLDLGPVDDAGREVRPQGDRVDLLLTVVGDDRQGALALLVLADAHDAGRLREDRGALGRAGLEELDDTRQTVGDVLTRDTTGVERPHGQLRTGSPIDWAAMMPMASPWSTSLPVASIVP